MIRKHAVVRGEVQGVGFRFHTQATASKLGVNGFVQNLADGSVDVEIEAEEAAVDRMLAWLREGPTWAIVRSVDVSELAPRGDKGFEIKQ
ncbi:acylphosphatase [Glaciihabitans tibetensis]|uniref:acylphosphatase n=1 Tax=Glaciihabitans tibetensis TaxID=1266600 RepID=A0A2T0VJT9_9MICO|nr:acylphosphatase [Glaciihabitans tibetensis]PRY70491.1 acylphosphatase [Glaciihabitans tibetensis]